MRFTVLLCGLFALLAIGKAEEGCIYGGKPFAKGTTNIAGKCQALECFEGRPELKTCMIVMPQCAPGSVFTEIPYDYAKDYPKCCPEYTCL